MERKKTVHQLETPFSAAQWYKQKSRYDVDVDANVYIGPRLVRMIRIRF